MAVRSIVTLLAAVSGLAALKAAWPCKVVHDDEEAYKLLFGRVICRNGVPRRYGPGPHLVFMGILKLVPVRVWQRENPVRQQSVRLRNNLEYQVGMALMYEVADPYLATFRRQQKLEEMMDIVASATLLELFAGLDHNDVRSPAEVAERLHAMLIGPFRVRGVTEFTVMFPVFHPCGEAWQLLLADTRRAEVERLTADGLDSDQAWAAVGASVMLGGSSHATNGFHANGNGHGNGHGVVALHAT